MITRSIPYVLVFGLLISIGLANSVSAQDEKSDKKVVWFDYDHCGICKNMASMEKDMHKVKWDLHMLDDGILMVSVVPRKMKAEMAKAEKGIAATVEKLESGEQVELCGFCQNYGMLMATGAKFKDIKSVAGNITIITSSDPDVVKKIQAFGKETKVEHDKMMAKSKSASAKKKEK